MTPRSSFVACSLILFAGCQGSVTDSENDDEPGAGGSATNGDGDGDVGPSAGGVVSAGTGGSSAGGSVSSTGGAVAVGGTWMMGGADMGGADAGMGGAGTGGEFVVPSDAVPSAGCALPAVDPEDMTSSNGAVYVSTPDGYDGSTPMPLILGFPAFGGRLGDILSEVRSDTNGVLRRNYVVVRAAPNMSDESTWEGDDVDLFDEVYRMVEESVCFDEARVFGVGNEGGARYLTKHVCEPVDGLATPNLFRALALVGFQTPPCDPWPDMPLLFMSSVETDWAFTDPDGRRALDEWFTEGQSCDDTPTDGGTWPAGEEEFDYVCEDYTGCSAGLRFCNWTQPIDGNDIWLATHNEHLHRFFADLL